MTAGRRPLLIALAAAVLVIVGLLIALIAASGGNSGGSHNPTPQTSKPADPRAAARAQIERVAEAWRKALNPKSPDNPCRYMTPEASDLLRSLADPRVGARGCAAVVRAAEPRGASVPLYQGLRSGVQNIRFRPRVDVATGTAPGAEAQWRADPERVVTFVERDGLWLIAK